MEALITLAQRVPLMRLDKMAAAIQTKHEHPMSSDDASNDASNDSAHQENDDLVILDHWW